MFIQYTDTFKRKEMKQAVKNLIAEIKSNRAALGYKTFNSSYNFRHLHIAYCLLRGTSMKRIESTVREGNEPNQRLIDKYTEKYKLEVKDETTLRACA